MKRIFALVICLGMMLFFSTAQAASVSVATSAGSLQGLPGSTITFDVLFNLDAGESYTFDTWNFGLQFDSTEISLSGSHDLLGAGGVAPDAVNPEIFYLTQFVGPEFDFIGGLTGESYVMGSFDFLINTPVLDGSNDFIVTGNQFLWFWDPDFGPEVSFPILMADTDVGIAAPVPVPAAVWLLGSGLFGLVGLRKRMTA